MELTGKVVEITPIKQIKAGFETQQIVVEWRNERGYDQTTAFDLKRTDKFDSIKKIAGIAVGNTVNVAYNPPTSRGHNGNWYTGVEAWKIEKVGGAQPSGNTQSPNNQGDSGDLPF